MPFGNDADVGRSGGLKAAFNDVATDGKVSKEEFSLIFHGAFFTHGMGGMRDGIVRHMETDRGLAAIPGAKSAIADKFTKGLKRVHIDSPKMLEHIFNVIDKDNSGTIDQSEWNAICDLFESPPATQDKFDALFKKLFEIHFLVWEVGLLNL